MKHRLRLRPRRAPSQGGAGKKHLEEKGHHVDDVGTHTSRRASTTRTSPCRSRARSPQGGATSGCSSAAPGMAWRWPRTRSRASARRSCPTRSPRTIARAQRRERALPRRARRRRRAAPRTSWTRSSAPLRGRPPRRSRREDHGARRRNLMCARPTQDPEVYAAIAVGDPAPARRPRADRVRELRVARPCSRRWAAPLTNKYAEGLPGKRYYGGCEFVDQVEKLARDRAKQLFGRGCEIGVNVQPHSGAQANAAIVPRGAQAGRHDPRPRPLARRAPHARLAGQQLRQALHAPCTTTSDARRPHRHGRGARPREEARSRS